jgi:hypothetical protein
MGKKFFAGLCGVALVLAGASSSFAHHAGGVEIGDLETGSVVGQNFKELPVDIDFNIMEGIGGKNIIYPPTAIINTKERGGRPVVLKVTNLGTIEHGFALSAGDSYAPPSSMNVKLTLKPGETKFIGIPTSDLTYTVVSGVLKYYCHLHPGHLTGQFVILK